MLARREVGEGGGYGAEPLAVMCNLCVMVVVLGLIKSLVAIGLNEEDERGAWGGSGG